MRRCPRGEEGDERELDGLLLSFLGPLDGLAQRLERGELLGDAGSSCRHGAKGSTPLAVGACARETAEASGLKDWPQEGCTPDHGATIMRAPALPVVVQLRNVTKTYGPVRALVGATCRFDSGTVSVVRGPNGSGKSTLLAVVGTLVRPTAGLIEHGDLGETRGVVRHSLGWVGHESLCYPDLSGRQNIELAARLQGVEAVGAYQQAADRFGLQGFADLPGVRTYSRGQRQRSVALARALVHGPRLVLLDEPTTGLDQAGAERLAQVVREEAARGAVVVIVTHDGAFVREVADRVVTMDRGRVVSDDEGRA